MAEVSVARKVSMNFEFIEGRKTGDKVVKFRGVRIADKEIVHYKGEGGGVNVVAEEHGGGGLGEAVLGKMSDKAELERIRTPIREDQAQFLVHHRRGRVCRGSDGGKVGDRIW
jgi:hypothetical protein